MRRLNRIVLLIWAAKIYYGILYKELFLPLDRTGKVPGNIATDLSGYGVLQYLIQAARVPMQFHSMDSPLPASIFIFELQPQDVEPFDFRDDIFLRTVLLRLGDVGVLIAFDAGAQWVGYRGLFDRYARCNFHPLQFVELGARLFYNGRMLNRHPKLITAEGTKRFQFLSMPIAGLSSKSVFDPFHADTYANFLSVFTGVPLDVIHPAENQLMSWLKTSKGRFNRMPIAKFPFVQV